MSDAPFFKPECSVEQIDFVHTMKQQMVDMSLAVDEIVDRAQLSDEQRILMQHVIAAYASATALFTKAIADHGMPEVCDKWLDIINDDIVRYRGG